MSLVSRPYNYSPNQTAYSSQVNANESTLYAVINGQLDSTNINISRGISASYINATAGAGLFQAGNYGFTPATSSGTPLTVQGIALQTAALQLWKSSTGILATVDAAGNFNTIGQVNTDTFNNTYSTSTGFFVNNVNAMNLAASGIATANVTASGTLTAQNATVNSTVTAALVNTTSLTVSSNATVTNTVSAALVNASSSMSTPAINVPSSVLTINIEGVGSAYFSATALELTSPSANILLGNSGGTYFALNAGIGSLVIPCIENDSQGGVNYQSASGGLGHRFFKYDGTTLANTMSLGINGGLTVVPNVSLNTTPGVVLPTFTSGNLTPNTQLRQVVGTTTVAFSGSNYANTSITMTGGISFSNYAFGIGTTNGTPFVGVSIVNTSPTTFTLYCYCPTSITLTVTIYYMIIGY